MADRQEIARRHGVPHLADQLVGETAAELEADAAARAALMQMFGSLKSAEEPEAEEVLQTQDSSEDPNSETPLPPGDKPFNEYTEAEWTAVHAESERKLAERQEPAEEPVVPEGLNPLHEALGFTEYDRTKAERDAALVRSIHSEGRGAD